MHISFVVQCVVLVMFSFLAYCRTVGNIKLDNVHIFLFTFLAIDNIKLLFAYFHFYFT